MHKTFSGVANKSSAIATFDFSDLKNYKDLTVEDFITIPMAGSTGLTRSGYDSTTGHYTRGNICINCTVTYDNNSGVLTMSMNQSSKDIDNPLMIVPNDTVHAYYIQEIK